MKVLVVDDSAVMRKVLIGALDRAGIKEVVQASDGVEAVECSKSAEVDLVLMDWNMPNMSGIDAVRAIRGMGKSMPIIMVTTEAEKGRVVEAIKSGANNYVIKPFTPEVIIEKINATLKRVPA
ncbi:MAG: response regulator [Candidatus Hydrogenedentota bacterium]